jgi:hypothetical protein
MQFSDAIHVIPIWLKPVSPSASNDCYVCCSDGITAGRL